MPPAGCGCPDDGTGWSPISLVSSVVPYAFLKEGRIDERGEIPTAIFSGTGCTRKNCSLYCRGARPWWRRLAYCPATRAHWLSTLRHLRRRHCGRIQPEPPRGSEDHRCSSRNVKAAHCQDDD